MSAPKFIIRISDGILQSVHTIGDDPNPVFYYLIDEDAEEIQGEEEDETTELTALIRQRLETNADPFLRVTDGTVTHPADLYRPEVICNNCEWTGQEADLVLFEDKIGPGNGCPNCKTDDYLTNRIR